MAQIPAFSLSGSDGATYSAKGLKGKAYVLYFYPKDNTPGCTTEACDFRDNMARIVASGVEVFGVSPDSLKSHEKFIAKFDLPFVLLSDPEHSLAEKLGAWGRKKFMGKEYDGVIRSTFLIGSSGSILKEWRGVKVAGHVDEVIAAIDELVAS
ncbi:MAG: thioredoxin-dependent thiol peroxidase [Planctomycetota bacterium]|nr:MAG: thioredoxin-dependent thiol peroxidase [Planctomycetota bacterium]